MVGEIEIELRFCPQCGQWFDNEWEFFNHSHCAVGDSRIVVHKVSGFELEQKALEDR